MTSKKFKKFLLPSERGKRKFYLLFRASAGNIGLMPLYLIRKLYWFIARPKSRGVKCVIQFGDELLMIRNTYGHKRWTFPGGGIKKGETLEQAAKRETMEEVGIAVDKLIFIGEFFIKAECRKDTVYCFKTSVNDKNFKIGEDEVAVAKWFQKDELPTDMSEYAKRALSLLNR